LNQKEIKTIFLRTFEASWHLSRDKKGRLKIRMRM